MAKQVIVLLLYFLFQKVKNCLSFVYNRAHSLEHSGNSTNTFWIHLNPQDDNIMCHQKGCQRVFNNMGKYLKISSEKYQDIKLYNTLLNI